MAAETNQRQAEHVKQLLGEQGITQKALAEAAGVTAQAVCAWAKGVQMRDLPARRIHERWPQYSVAWIRGFTEVKSESDLFEFGACTSYETYSQVERAVFALARFGAGFDVTLPFVAMDTDDPIQATMRESVMFGKGERSVTLTADECSTFVKEVSGYVEMRLEGMLERGRW